MRLSKLTNPPLQLFDRAPQNQELWYGQNAVAPHARTQRATLTVAAAKRLWLPSAHIFVRRAVAAAPVGVVTVELDLNTGDTMSWRLDSNAVGTLLVLEIPLGLYFDTGETIRFWTTDTSTNGSIDYWLTAFGTQFSKVSAFT